MSNFVKSRSGVYVPMGALNGAYLGPRYFFWAEYGELNMVDKETGRHFAWNPRLAMLKLQKIREGVGKSSAPGVERDAQERTLMTRGLQKIEELIKTANEQAAKMPQLVPNRLLLT